MQYHTFGWTGFDRLSCFACLRFRQRRFCVPQNSAASVLPSVLLLRPLSPLNKVYKFINTIPCFLAFGKFIVTFLSSLSMHLPVLRANTAKSSIMINTQDTRIMPGREMTKSFTGYHLKYECKLYLCSVISQIRPSILNINWIWFSPMSRY